MKGAQYLERRREKKHSIKKEMERSRILGRGKK